MAVKAKKRPVAKKRPAPGITVRFMVLGNSALEFRCKRGTTLGQFKGAHIPKAVNQDQFETPETRDVRVILNPDEAKVEEARAALEQDDSPENWEKVAKQFSTDEATKNDGGLREAVAQGQNEPALDEAIFSAAEGSLVGPISGDSGSYVIQVEQINESSTTPLAFRPQARPPNPRSSAAPWWLNVLVRPAPTRSGSH